jgi:hypothetical protein
MANKDHTLIEAVDLIAERFQQNPSTSAELIASCIENLRRDPEMNLSEALVYSNRLMDEDVELIKQAQEEAAPYELQIEVMASTVQAIRKDPELDLSIALQYGLGDWDI